TTASQQVLAVIEKNAGLATSASEVEMRLAVLIVGLVLTIGLFIQSATVGTLSEVADDQETSSAAAGGIFMALIWLFAVALVIPLPRVAMVMFVLAGLLGFAGVSELPDLAFWSVISFVLAALSYFGYRGKRQAEAKEKARDELLRQALAGRPIEDL